MILTDKNDIAKKYVVKRNSIISNFVYLRGHSFPDIIPQSGKYILKYIKQHKTSQVQKLQNQAYNKQYQKLFLQGASQYKKTHPEFTFYDRDIKKI
jgi:hypothetical protein